MQYFLSSSLVTDNVPILRSLEASRARAGYYNLGWMGCLNWAHACTWCEVSPVLRNCNSVGKKMRQSQRQWLDAESWGPSGRVLLGKRGQLSSSRSSWQSHHCGADVQILAGAIDTQFWPVASSAQSNQKFWRKYPPCMDRNSGWGAKPDSLNWDFPKYRQHFIPLPNRNMKHFGSHLSMS